jgi:hypothetical protein
MDGTLDNRVTSLIRDLFAIQAELSASAQPRSGLAPPRLSAEVARQFRSAVDSLRLALWAYIDSRSGAATMEDTLQRRRVERIVEMLQAVRGDIADGALPAPQETSRLLGEFQAIADLAQKRTNT